MFCFPLLDDNFLNFLLQTIQLPVDQAVLTSFVLPDSKNYKYSWELVYPLNQVDIGNIEGLNKDQVK